MPLIEIKGLDPRMLTTDVVSCLKAYQLRHQATLADHIDDRVLWERIVERRVTSMIRTTSFPNFRQDTTVTFSFSLWREATAQNVVVIVRGLFVHPGRTRDTKNGLLNRLNRALSWYIPLGWGLELWTESVDLHSEGYWARE